MTFVPGLNHSSNTSLMTPLSPTHNSILLSRMELGKPQSAFMSQQQQQLLPNPFLGPPMSGLGPASIVASMESPVAISSLTHSAISAAAEAAAAAACGLASAGPLAAGRKLIASKIKSFFQNLPNLILTLINHEYYFETFYCCYCCRVVIS